MTKTKSVKEVADTPRVFGARVSNKTFALDGITYTIESLPNSVTQFIAGEVSDRDGSVNRGEMLAYITAFGVTNWSGLKDKVSGKRIACNRENITIMRRQHEWLTQESFNAIPSEHVTEIAMRVEALSSLSEEELDKLDFTKPLSEWKEVNGKASS